MSKWSRSEVIALVGSIAAVIGCVAAVAVVPEIREYFGFRHDSSATTAESTADPVRPLEDTPSELLAQDQGRVQPSGETKKSSGGAPNEPAPMPSNQVQHAVDTQEYLERVALSEIGEGIFVEEAGKAVPFNKSPIVTLATAEKRPVLVYSWALWSERSMRDLSHIAQLEEQHRDVIFLGLNDDIPRRRYAAQAESMAHSLETTYFIRDLGIVQSIFRDKKVDLPAYAIFNEDGEVADRFIGSIGTYPSLRRRLEGKLQSVKTNSAQPGER